MASERVDAGEEPLQTTVELRSMILLRGSCGDVGREWRSGGEGGGADRVDDQHVQSLAGIRSGDASALEQREHDLPKAPGVGPSRALASQVSRDELRVDE